SASGSAFAGQARIEMFDAHDLIQPDAPVPGRHVGALQLQFGIDSLAIRVVTEHLSARSYRDHAFAGAAIAKVQHNAAIALQFAYQRLEPANTFVVDENVFCLPAHEASCGDPDHGRIYALERQERVKCGPFG